MSRRGFRDTVLTVVLLGILTAACAPAASTGSSASPGASATPASLPTASPPSSSPAATATASIESLGLTVYAAASLKDAVDSLVAAYEQVVPGITLTVSTGASSALRTQIEQGAPADVFLSADTNQPAALAVAGLTSGSPKLIAGNRLAVIVPSANPAAITSPTDLGRPGVKIVAAGDAVPITTYATELVAKLAALPGYPPGFADGYAANVVSREDDVKAVVAKIELGEGDAAIVYRTDALASTVVATIAIPPEADVVASYAGVLVAAGQHRNQARAFLDWLTGPEAQAIFASFGFSPPGS